MHIVCPYCVGHNVLVKLFRHILLVKLCRSHFSVTLCGSHSVGHIMLGQMCFVFMFQICHHVHLVRVIFVKYDNFIKVTSTVLLMAVPLAKII